MNDPTPHQADILAFPARPLSDQGQARLLAALARLHGALEEQRTAVAAWRGALGNLKQAVEHLGTSVGNYRSNLAMLAVNVQDLNHKARILAGPDKLQ